MDCTRVEELLALFSGSDLDARQTEAVRNHLAVCPACHTQADELAASRAWLQAAPSPQFDEAFYADLRQSVLRELPAVKEEGGQFAWLAGWLPQWRWQPVLALAATGLLLVVGWAVYRKSSGQPNIKRAPEIMVINPAATALPEQKYDLTGHSPNVTPHGLGSSNRTLSSVRRGVKRRPLPPRDAVLDEPKAALLAQTNTPDVGTSLIVPTPEPEMTRIEFQTADPNIRIIWFAPKPDTAAPASK